MKLTVADKWLIGILLLLSLSGIGFNLAALSSEQDQIAKVYSNGSLVKTVPLKEGYRDEFRLGDAKHYNVIEVDGKKIRVKEADCKDQICVNMGWISTAPQQLVCIPHHLVITITNVRSDIDSISR